jgi:hypothetical protein
LALRTSSASDDLSSRWEFAALLTSLRGKCIANGRLKSLVAALMMGKHCAGVARPKWGIHTVVGELHGCKVSPRSA